MLTFFATWFTLAAVVSVAVGRVFHVTNRQESPCQKPFLVLQHLQHRSKRYVGASGDDEHVVVVYPPNGAPYELNPRFDVRNHSPTGFCWGYHGSGPAQLALAILCDYLGRDEALRYYQQFKDAAIATIPRENNFELTTTEIDVIVRELRKRSTF